MEHGSHSHFRPDGKQASMLLDNGIRGGQAQARPRFFSCEIRVKYLGYVCRGYAFTMISNTYTYIFSLCQRVSLVLADICVFRPYQHRSAAWHCLEGIND